MEPPESSKSLPPYSYRNDCDPPYQLVAVEQRGQVSIPSELRKRIFIHTVHDGGAIPKRYRMDENGNPRVDLEELERRYIRERDWGANLVARKISEALGIPGFARVKVARVLLDFNRFPGSTPPTGHDPLERLAISRPFSTVLNHNQKLELLERYYDTISDLIEQQWLRGALMMIGVHTYDEHNPSQTQRPALSIMSSVASYMRDKHMPFGVFDPMYPDSLAESTCSRVLRDRISLNLERNGFRVAHNYPYALPEGSMEVRAQVWFFFDFLRNTFQKAHPETVEDDAYRRVWTMLLNTNLRLHEAESLRGYLHRLRKVTSGEVKKFRRSQEAYTHIQHFLEANDVATAFRRCPTRPSSFAIEVRKDLVCDFDPRTGRPLPISPEIDQRASLIGNVIAGAIATYFDVDVKFR